MRAGKIISRKSAKGFLTPIFRLKYRGRVVGEFKDISILQRTEEVRAIINTVVLNYMNALLKEMRMRIDRDAGAHSRTLVNDDIPLMEAYKTASQSSTISESKNRIRFRFFDTSMMDKLTPRSENSTGKDRGGWWRIHEHGEVGSMVGQSREYGFAPAKMLEGVLTKNGGPPYGRHGEGLMIKVDSPLGTRLGIRPFPGVRPKRIARGAQMYFRKSLESMRYNMFRDIGYALTQGLGKK